MGKFLHYNFDFIHLAKRRFCFLWLFFFVLIACVFIASAASAAKTRCGMSLFEYFNTGDNNVNSVVDPKWEAQTFTPQASHIIKKVRIKIYRLGLPGKITVGIRKTDADGKPFGANLALGSIDGNTFTENSSGEWYTIGLGKGALLDAGVKYAIVLGNGASGWARWKVNTNSNYEGGTALTSFDSGNTWVFCDGGGGEYGRYDALFEEWGIGIQSLKNINLYAKSASDGFGLMSYNASGPIFDFSFTGKAPINNDWYALVLGEDPKNHPETAIILDYPRSDGDTGKIIINKSIDLNRDLKKMQVWLVLGRDLMLLPRYDGYTGWFDWRPQYYLFGDGLVNYNDNDKSVYAK